MNKIDPSATAALEGLVEQAEGVSFEELQAATGCPIKH